MVRLSICCQEACSFLLLFSFRLFWKNQAIHGPDFAWYFYAAKNVSKFRFAAEAVEYKGKNRKRIGSGWDFIRFLPLSGSAGRLLR